MKKYYTLQGASVTDENGTAFSTPVMTAEYMLYGDYNTLAVTLEFYASSAAVERGNRALVVPAIPKSISVNVSEYFTETEPLTIPAPFGLADIVAYVGEAELSKFFTRNNISATIQELKGLMPKIGMY